MLERPPEHTVEITTPTGHSYVSTAPPLPGTSKTLGSDPEADPEGLDARALAEADSSSPVEGWLAEWLALVA